MKEGYHTNRSSVHTFDITLCNYFMICNLVLSILLSTQMKLFINHDF